MKGMLYRDYGSGVQGPGFRVQGPECRVQGPGFMAPWAKPGGAVAALLPFVFIPPSCALAGPPRLVARGRLLSVYRVLSLDLRYRAQSLWWSLVDVRG